MPSINRVVITGNLGRDPELKRTKTGMAVMGLSVAVNDRVKDKQTGEWVDYTNWVECTLFGKRAESLEHYLHKGTAVMIDGKLRYESWEKDGQKRNKLGVLIDEIQFSNAGKKEPEPEPQAQNGAYSDSDIPF